MMMSNMKTVGVFVVIFSCFAILYPKIFHPMVVHVFGLSTGKGKDDRGSQKHPQEMPNRATPHPPRNPSMRAAVHPGMRAAEMRKQAGDQGGGGNKGMINMVLPMYAVGIVIYLVYTMAKVFMRNKKPDEPGPFQSKSEFYNASSYKDDAGPYFNYPTENLDDETRFLLSKREKLEELEELLAKAELKQINDIEMVTLRERLEETESQMSRILKAMESVQTRVKDGIDAHLESRGRKQPREEVIEIVKVAATAEPAAPEEEDETSPSLTQQAALNKDLNALDSESSGTESDDERSDEDEERDEEREVEDEERDVEDGKRNDEDKEDEEENDEDEEDENEEYEDEDDEEDDDDDDESDNEKGVRDINGIGRLDMNPTNNDVMQHLAQQFDLVPDSDSDGVMRGDVMGDLYTGSDLERDLDDVIQTVGAVMEFTGGDSDDGLDLGLRQRKSFAS